MFTVEEFKKIFDRIDLPCFRLDTEGLPIGEFTLVVMSERCGISSCEGLPISVEGKLLGSADYIYKHFLQEVIEGINRTKSLVCINQYGAQIGCYVDDNEYYITHSKKNEDQAKEQAIRYVLEKMEG